MAKNEETPVVEAPAPEPVDIAALDTAIAAAQAQVDKVQAGYAEAGGDLTKMLAFADAIKKAKFDLDRATATKASATYSLRQAERLEFSTGLKEQIEAFVSPFETKARELSLTGIHIVFGGESGMQVSVTDASRPVGKRTTSSTRKAGETVGADGKNRSLWTYNGATYTSRQLIQEFGDGAMGEGWSAKVFDRADNWAEPRWGPNGNEPMKSGPGFNAPLVALATKIGAVR